MGVFKEMRGCSGVWAHGGPGLNTALVLAGFGLAVGQRTVLDSIDLALAPRGCTALVGPRDAGKSALLRWLAGYSDPNPAVRTWGQALYGQQPLGRGQRPPLVPQRAAFGTSTVLESLLRRLPNRAGLTPGEQIDAVCNLAASTGQGWIASRLDMPADCLAPHEQRMVAILREAIAAPAVLMVDDACAGLEGGKAQEVCALLRRLAERSAVLAVFGARDQVLAVASEVVLIAGGTNQELAAPSAFFTAPRSRAGRQFVETGRCPGEDVTGLPMAAAPA